jgi:hypothetical protein
MSPLATSLIIVFVFLIINSLLVVFILTESAELKFCENGESVFCPSVSCNETKETDITTPSYKKCGSKPYRTIPSGEIVCKNPPGMVSVEGKK